MREDAIRDAISTYSADVSSAWLVLTSGSLEGRFTTIGKSVDHHRSIIMGFLCFACGLKTAWLLPLSDSCTLRYGYE